MIWSGRGFWVFLILFFSALIVDFIATAIMLEEALLYGQLITAFTFFLAAVGVVVYTRLSPRQKPREVIDRETGEIITLSSNDWFLFIPVRFWSIIYAVLGVAMIIAYFVI